MVLGLDAKVIGSAFLTSPAAMGKRLVRAKDKIRQAGIPFAVPGREALWPAVCEAGAGGGVYAAFSEGWSDPEGGDAVRRDLTGEAPISGAAGVCGVGYPPSRRRWAFWL